MVRSPSRLRGARDPAGDLAAVGDQDGCEHGGALHHRRNSLSGKAPSLGHDLTGKPDSTFPDHALARIGHGAGGRQRRWRRRRALLRLVLSWRRFASRLAARRGFGGPAWQVQRFAAAACSLRPAGDAGSAFMMLIAGIEADDGKSYLPDGGMAAPVVAMPGTAASAGRGWHRCRGSGRRRCRLSMPRRRVHDDIGVEAALAQIGGDMLADRAAA